MSNLRKTAITETRIYDNPKSPATSPYDLALPLTVTDAVIDSATGKPLTEILTEIGEGSHIPGVDLAALHAAEIAAVPYNGNIWAWIQARIKAGNYKGINVGDSIQFTAGGNVIIAEVAGIETYRRTSYPEVPRHIDFISRDLWPTIQQWNRANYNNGLTANANPWIVSNLYAWLNGLAMNVPSGTGANPATVAVDYTTTGLFPQLPAELRAVIVQKSVGYPTRYSSGVLLTDDNSWNYGNIGNLWIPSEVEVFGSVVFGTPGFSMAGYVQYPIFASNMFKRIKGVGNGGPRDDWWLSVPHSGSSSGVASVGTLGAAEWSGASGARCVPVCFRIA